MLDNYMKKDNRDYIIKKNRKYFRMFCPLCGKDKGYKNPESAKRPCYSCNGKKASRESLRVRQKIKTKCSSDNCADLGILNGKCEKHYQSLKRPKKIPILNCLICESNIANPSSWRKYCSESCNSKAWIKRHPSYSKERMKNNINARLAARLRNRIWQALHAKNKIGSAINQLGCTVTELVQYLEEKFQSGMSWENYGKWHIDHIKPLSSFNLADKDEFNKACNYSNLQPLWAKDNQRKSNKYLVGDTNADEP